LTRDHVCFLAKDHGGRHACYCGVWWDETGRIKLRRQPSRRRWTCVPSDRRSARSGAL